MMQKTITLAEAADRLWPVIEQAPNIAGLVPYANERLTNREQWDGDYLTLEWRRGWAIDATVSLSLFMRGDSVEYSVSVSWSSAHRNIAAALAAAALHSEVIAFAALLQAAIDQLPTIRREL